MSAAYRAKQAAPTGLAAQIRDAERQVAQRQRQVGLRAATLLSTVRRQISSPASLLLAGGGGFVLGELTRRPAPQAPSTDGQPAAEGRAPWHTVLNLIGSARALYTGLVPILWMVKSRQQQGPKGPERRSGKVQDGA